MPPKTRIDPYGFVPLIGEPQRVRVAGRTRFDSEAAHGMLTCRLTTKTPLFIYDPVFATPVGGGHEQVRFPVFNRVAVIPGSSLKGAIRSVVEAAEASCLVFPETGGDGSYQYRGSGITRGQEVQVRIPQAFRRCRDTRDMNGRKVPGALCPACRLFGALHREWAWTGKVSISDARSNDGEYSLMTPLRTLGVLSAPKPEARQRTYIKADRTIVGRKFYRHRRDAITPIVTRQEKDRQNKTVQPVAPESIFHFTVEYADLSKEELRALLYGLFLEEGLWHKVGMGKPLGLGSVHIEAIRWVEIDAAARYRTLGGGASVPLEGEALERELADRTSFYRSSKGKTDQPSNLKELRDILRHDHDWDVGYPPPESPGSTPGARRR